jgi:hypothetical protein
MSNPSDHSALLTVPLPLSFQSSLAAFATDTPPPPTLIDSEEEYEVEEILDSHMHYNCLEYLVKWKGYEKSHNE